MRVLVVTAVGEEIRPLVEDPGMEGLYFPLVTGAGIPATVYRLSGAIQSQRPDVIVNAGVCGSFNERFPPGTVVRVMKDIFGDLGAEDGDRFIHITGLGLDPGAASYLLNEEPALPPFGIEALKPLPEARAITVNTVHGREDSILQARANYNPDVESMEGAAVFYVARLEGIPAIQVRAVSNRVELRNRSAWELEKAITRLGVVLKALVRELAEAGNKGP